MPLLWYLTLFLIILWVLSWKTPQRSECGQLIIRVVSFGIIIAPLQILQSYGNNTEWCQVIGENYIGTVCSDKVECGNVVVKVADTAASCQNHFMSCKGSSWTPVLNRTLTKWCIPQKACSECIYGLSSCSEKLMNFIWHTVLGLGRELLWVLPLLSGKRVLDNICQNSWKIGKRKVFWIILGESIPFSGGIWGLLFWEWIVKTIQQLSSKSVTQLKRQDGAGFE